MKLVDILARELKEWPERADWVVSVAEPGDKFTASFGYGNFPVPDPFDRNFHTWSVLRTGGQWEIVSRSAISQKLVDRLEAIVTRAQWQSAVDALKSDQCAHDYANKHGCPECGEMASPAWTGEGLPPVGAVCEAELYVRGEGERWVTIRALAQHPEDLNCMAVMDDASELRWANKFRPASTPEQIAEKERETAIKQFMQIGDIYWDTASALYDAGARLPGRGAKA